MGIIFKHLMGWSAIRSYPDHDKGIENVYGWSRFEYEEMRTLNVTAQHDGKHLFKDMK